MRITCPNCKATYEVGDADIPDEGIEVECSACLNRWDQMPAGYEAEDTPAATEALPEETPKPEPAPVDADVADTAPEPEPEPVAETTPAPEPVPESKTSEPEAENEMATTPQPEPEPLASASVPDPESAPFGQGGAVVDFPSASGVKATDWEEPVYDPNWERKGALDPSAPSEVEAITNTAEPSSDAPSTAASPDWEEPVYDPNWERKGPSEPPAPRETEASEDIVAPSGAAPSASTPDWQNHEKSELADPSRMDAPTDVTDDSRDGETDPVPSAGWRVPKPPETAAFEQDPLDAILAEVNTEAKPSAPAGVGSAGNAGLAPVPTEAPAAEASPPPVTEAEPVAPDLGGAPSAPATAAPSETDQDVADEAAAPAEADRVTDRAMHEAAEPEVDAEAPIPEPAPEPVAPHWSELAGSLAPVVVEKIVSPKPVTDPKAQETTEDATKDIESFIRERVETAAEPAASDAPHADAPEAPIEEEEVFHPWDGEVAPAIVDEPEPDPEEDEFEWVEPPNADTPLTFDPTPDENDPLVEQHIEALARQNQEDLRPSAPEVSNVIRADIPQAPVETIPSSNVRSITPQPGKPTPVESAEDVEAAIRAQLSNMKTPSGPQKPENAVGKSGIFAKLAKSKAPTGEEPPSPPAAAAAQKSVDPLKAALSDFGAERASGSSKRRGFMLVMVLFVLALLVYVFGGMISGLVPAMEPYISGYSGMVDGLREMTQKLIGG